MAKECELLCKTYEELRVVPVGAAAAGEVVVYDEVVGFHLVAFSAIQVAAGESAALIIKAERCQVIKNTGEVWKPGEAVYWDPTNNWFTNVAGALSICGVSVEDVASAVVTAVINFDGRVAFLKA